MYLPFNENIVTKDSYIIQNDAGDKLVEVTRKASYPIYVKDEKRYGVQMGNTLVYIPKSAIAATKQADNTSEPVAKQIPVSCITISIPEKTVRSRKTETGWRSMILKHS